MRVFRQRGWVAAALLTLLVTACGSPAGEGIAVGAATDAVFADEEVTGAAEAYFQALADLDYRTMETLSTGLANTAARYGLQVLAADPDAFGAREVEVVEPLQVRSGSPILDGALDLESKGLPGPPLRIRDVTMATTGDGHLVEGYTRDGRTLEEVFRDLDIDMTVDGATVSADLVLTDPIQGVVLLPVTVQAEGLPVQVGADGSRLADGGPPLADGGGTVEAGDEAVFALTFRDVADPGSVSAVELVIVVGEQSTKLLVPLQ